ncbi:putative catechol dioxygenase [Tricharina praecox]|uniref:putative catechol dioxygenase n=1 Tax=Tricharina praecox TaxID=43433 RepID=UPI00221E5829|nr:putative catechol dioxygenase [Tricharina praecox]KAI5857267.1 putative catechol dioxygenase [Tricharina praecox]
MDPSQVKIPPMKDLTADNITENTIIINSQGPDRRLQYLLERLVTHLHDFARETRLTTEEWMAGIMFLTAVGQICSDTRQEFILLSDVLGLSTLVENINHPKPANATEGTVLGPFHTEDAHEFAHGDSICSDGKGEACLVRCTLKDTTGAPIANASVDIWETDETGHYDTQYADRSFPDCRGILKTDDEGNFWFRAIRPVPYPIPHDGPVGKMLEMVHRHPYRPSHMHFMIIAKGYDTLVTSLYIRGDPYETSDAVFGVKSSLIIDVGKVEDPAVAEKYGVDANDWAINYDFVLVSDKEARELKLKNAQEALKALGSTAQVLNGLPVADLD